EPRLFPYAQITDGVLGPGEPDLSKLGRMSPNERRMPGDGTLPLRQILDALPASLPLSVEVPMPKTVRLPAREWARATAESMRRFGGESKRRMSRDIAEHPDYMARLSRMRTGAARINDAPQAIAEVAYTDLGEATAECELFQRGVAGTKGFAEPFMTAASPG